MSKINASLQAFVEEIQNWELTLNRQARKLKQVKKLVKSKFKLNSIQICLVSIQSECIQYRKIKEKLTSNIELKSLTSDAILSQYSISSRRFMDILQKIANINLEEDRQDSIQNSQIYSNLKNNEQKSFLGQTFSFKVSKNQNKQKSKSYFQTRKKDNSIVSAKNTHFKKPIFEIKQSQNKKSQNQNVSMISANYFDKKRISGLQMNNTSQLSGIKQQLAQIKSLMKEMHSQIVYHDHQQINKQLQKMQNSNRRMGVELKALKEQNKYILSKIQMISDNLQQQKKQQAQMIEKFEKKQNRSNIVSHSAERQRHITSKDKQENLSDWVKIRI